MSRPSIALGITRSDAIGGSQIHVRDLAVSLRCDGYPVRIFVGGRGPYVEMLRREGLDVHVLEHLRGPVSPRHDLMAVLEMRRALRQFRPALIALHTGKVGLVGRLAAMGSKTPVVVNPHGWAFVDGVPRGRAAIFRILERLVAPLADRFITVSDFSRQLALNAGVGTERQIRCISNGVKDVPDSLRAVPDRGTPRMCVVARLDAPKDPFTLLHALAKLRRDGPWNLEWLGDGPLLEESRQLAERLGIGARCRFLGARDDVAARLANASIAVLPTRHESLPLCLLEAMRAGLPVVASNVGGVPEIVVPKQTGILVPSADSLTLAAALAALVDSPAARRQMGDAGRRRYETHFSFRQQYAATLQVYGELLPLPLAASSQTRIEQAHVVL